ncbi:MAG: hypothetical protein KAJ14_03980 [Candidatus Omnitrophica bacterium]|nr:hypothetical protein [Candidatus Omnitrophota bacterium]
MLVSLASKYLKRSDVNLGELLGIGLSGLGLISITKEKGRILYREKRA